MENNFKLFYREIIKLIKKQILFCLIKIRQIEDLN